MIGKAQMAIVDFYIAKEKWLKDTTGKDKDFINTELLSEICLWTNEECEDIITVILANMCKGKGYFSATSCPHCIKYYNKCIKCTYKKKYGKCDTCLTNPWNYYHKYNLRKIPKYVMNILKKGI